MTSSLRQRILAHLRIHPWSTKRQLVAALEVTWDAIRRNLETLVAEGKVVKAQKYDGNNSSAFALVGESVPPPSKPVSANKTISSLIQQAILNYLRTYPWMRVDALAKGLKKSALIIRSNLQVLVDAGEVERRKVSNQTQAYVYALSGETAPLPEPVVQQKAPIKLRIMYYLSMHPSTRVEEIAHGLQVSTDTVYRGVKELLNEREITKRKKGDGKRTLVYELVEEM